MQYDHEKMKRWLLENIGKSPCLQEIAGEFKLSPESLRKYFRQLERKPISKFLDEARLRQMQEKLLTTNRYCYEIADDFKFSNDANAARWFKRKTGMTMMEFRERNGAQCGDANCLDEWRKRNRETDVRTQKPKTQNQPPNPPKKRNST